MKILIVTFIFLLSLQNIIFAQLCKPNIAVIGGGIGGASASHFLSDLFDGNLYIDIYEAKEIGGRLATVEIDNNEYEAGGSVIHPRNRYMLKFAKLLGLEHRPKNEQMTGIWNGREFVFKESQWNLINLAKLLYRYGTQPFKLHRYVDNILYDFEQIYGLQDAGLYFENVTSMLSALNSDFPKLLQTTIKDHLLSMNYKDKIIDELVKATLVVNYGQSTNVHAFVGCVSLAGAGSGLWAVKGGNAEVPKHLIYSNYNVNIIPAVVSKINYLPSANNSYPYELHYTTEDNKDIMLSYYDMVIIASPLTADQNTPIEFEGFPEDFEFPGEYQTTHVTFVKADLNSNYFKVDENINSILSCNPNLTKISSVGKLNTVEGLNENSKVWKIFSQETLEQKIVDEMFSNIDELEEIIWKAYPKYSTEFRLDKFKLHNFLYYVNAIEWAASAMEMSAISGRNIANMAHNDYYSKKCPHISQHKSQVPKKHSHSQEL